MVSVFEKHKKEIEFHETVIGKELGRLMFAVAILSDIEAEFPKTREEVEEVKELLISLIPEIEEYKKRKLAEVL